MFSLKKIGGRIINNGQVLGISVFSFVFFFQEQNRGALRLGNTKLTLLEGKQ